MSAIVFKASAVIHINRINLTQKMFHDYDKSSTDVFMIFRYDTEYFTMSYSLTFLWTQTSTLETVGNEDRLIFQTMHICCKYILYVYIICTGGHGISICTTA